ncbi:30252_t:CDS:1, partial [Racocetra persica]
KKKYFTSIVQNLCLVGLKLECVENMLVKGVKKLKVELAKM